MNHREPKRTTYYKRKEKDKGEETNPGMITVIVFFHKYTASS